MATGIFKLRDQLLGLVQKAWYTGNQPLNTWASYAGSFNGSTQYLNATLPSSLAGQFTIEFWAYETASTNCFFTLGDSKNANGIEIYTSGSLYACYTNNSSYFTAANSTIPSGTWLHLALTRDSSNIIRFFINGVPLFTSTSNTNAFSSSLYIGVEFYNGAISATKFNGYMSNFRVLNGTCLYTTSFSPPASALTNITNTAILTLQNATIIDNSSNSLTITNTGSVATSTQTIAIGQTITPNSNPTPAVEYLVVGGGGGSYVGGGGAGGLIQGVTSITTGTPITVTIGGGGAFSGTPTSGQNSVFGNITAVGGAASANASTAPSGGSGGGGSYTAVTTGGQGTFGQGNAGGTNTSGTTNAAGGGGAGTVGLNSTSSSCGNGGAGIASAINGTVTAYAGGGGGSGTGTAGVGGVGGGGTGNSSATTGNNGTANTGGGGGGSYNASGYGNGGSGICIISYPDIYNPPVSFGGANSPTVSTSGSGSVIFSGTSNQSATYSTSNLGTGNFTVECWFYNTDLVNEAIFSIGTYLTGIDVRIAESAANKLDFYFYNVIKSGSFTSTNTWQHLAIVRNSGTTTVYLNGAVFITAFSDTNSYVGSTRVGSFQAGAASHTSFAGQISNFRLTNTAVYTTTFTPSTAPLTAISGTQLLLNTVSPSGFNDSSINAYTPTLVSTPTWNQLSPFATGLGYKNRVYTWTGSGTITF
jgi:hypothetical protein